LVLWLVEVPARTRATIGQKDGCWWRSWLDDCRCQLLCDASSMHATCGLRAMCLSLQHVQSVSWPDLLLCHTGTLCTQHRGWQQAHMLWDHLMQQASCMEFTSAYAQCAMLQRRLLLIWSHTV
jgi:hypothetical protein